MTAKSSQIKNYRALDMLVEIFVFDRKEEIFFPYLGHSEGWNNHPWVDNPAAVVPVHPYSTDESYAFLIIEEMHSRGFSFGMWWTHVYSSACQGIQASFIRSVYPPSYNGEPSGIGFVGMDLYHFGAAVALAALSALGVIEVDGPIIYDVK